MAVRAITLNHDATQGAQVISRPRYEPHPTLPSRFINVDRPSDPPVTVGEIHAEYLTGWGRELADLRVGADLRPNARPNRSAWRWFKRN